MTHALKIETNYFKDIIYGNKNFEVRKNDRDFHVDDYIALNELSVTREEYTGRSILVKVTSIVDDERFCKEGFIIMGLEKCSISGNGDIGTVLDGEERKL